jgi:two-component system sensor histidine kinase GlrK
MRPTIFWRVILAQSALIVLILAVCLYSFMQLRRLTMLNAAILAVDTPAIGEEKQLLKTFLSQMRNAEKYLLLKDSAFHASFLEGGGEFAAGLAKVETLVDSPRERNAVREIGDLQERYQQHLAIAVSDKSSWESAKTGIADGIIERINELIWLREQAIADKMIAARDQAASAATVMAWLAFAGITGGLLLAYFHARSVSRPLELLAREMLRVGKGKPGRSLDFRASREVHQLAESFNWMAEKLAHLDKLKADFTAHVSHELRTPLTAIREGTALLLEEIPGPLATPQREIVEVMRAHSDRLHHSISSILDLSKMEAEMMEYEFMACDLTDLIKESMETVGLIAQGKGIQLTADLSGRLPIVMIDERRIHQVLDNLLSNGLKFTPEGGSVAVSARLSRDGGAKVVEVRVSDTGEGIPEQDLESVFDRFYQSVRGGKKRIQGTGLGLAIARHVIEAHKGRIWVESELGRGSTFAFTLPLVREELKPSDG